MNITKAKEVLGPIRLHRSGKQYMLDQEPVSLRDILTAATERLMQIGFSQQSKPRK